MTPDQQQRLARIRAIADLMDARYGILGIRFGLDSIIGLVPWLGDAVAGLIATYVIWEAYRMGIPRAEINKMISRVLIDLVVGGIPVVGDIFDVFYKANQRNLRAIEAYVANT